MKKHVCKNYYIKKLRLLVFSKLKTLLTYLKNKDNKVIISSIITDFSFQICPSIENIDKPWTDRSVCCYGHEFPESRENNYLNYIFTNNSLNTDLNKLYNNMADNIDCIFRLNIKNIISDFKNLKNQFLCY